MLPESNGLLESGVMEVMGVGVAQQQGAGYCSLAPGEGVEMGLAKVHVGLMAVQPRRPCHNAA